MDQLFHAHAMRQYPLQTLNALVFPTIPVADLSVDRVCRFCADDRDRFWDWQDLRGDCLHAFRRERTDRPIL